jgi:hypothetical protein
MSTKNLARTVIEGGRARHNQFMRRYSNAAERAHVHQLERALCRADPHDDALFEPRDVVYRGFSDKLGPAMRWLRSQVGRPWNKVRAELFERFDARTTAGRHILFDHLLAEVATEPAARVWKYSRFDVSKHGLLQYRGRERYVSSYRMPSLSEPEQVLRDWLGARRVVAHGSRLYWLVQTSHGAFRQGHQLATEEAARFRALPAWFAERFFGTLPPGGGVK